MNYIQERCLFQVIIVSEFLKSNPTETLTRIRNYYPLNNEENTALQKYVSDKTFNRLNTSDAVQLHLNFIKSFYKNTNAFGTNDEENRALEIKLLALDLIKGISGVGERFETLSKHAEKNDRLSVSLALMYILKGDEKKRYLPLLRRADAHGYPEAAIVLMVVEPEKRPDLYEKLENSKELYLLMDDTIASIAAYYKIKKTLEE